MTLQEALYELEVRDDTLSQAEKAHLDSEGYVLLPNILSAAQIASICRAMDAVYAAEGTGQKDGPAESSYMQNKTAGLDICFTHPRVLAAICHVLDGCIKSFGRFTVAPIRPAANSRLCTSITMVLHPKRNATPCATRCGC